MRKLLLLGNPNVGKSVVFSRLTGTKVIASNYPGTTVGYTIGELITHEETFEVIDVPGTYCLEPTCKAEEVATEMISEGDIIINVIDSTNLERNLHLTLELMESDKPMIVALNMYDEVKHHGIEIDVERLEELLGVPVVTTCGISGEGIKTLIERIPDAAVPPQGTEKTDKWLRVGEIIGEVQKITHHHHTLLERLADVSMHPWTGIPFAAFVGFACFWVIRSIGESLIHYVFDPFFYGLYSPLIMKLSAVLGEESFIHHLLIGHLTGGELDFAQSMGLLTTGLYVPIAMVLPYVFAFYLVLSIMEDTGYLPRLGVLMDTFMHRLGLHGLTIIPMLLGFGCNVPGVLSTRIFETRKQRFVSAVLTAICIPCMAQTAMVFGLLGKYGARGLVPVFGTLALLWLGLALFFKAFARGETPEIFLEIPPYRIPSGRAVYQKMRLRMKQFILEAEVYVLLGVFIINILYTLNIIQVIGDFLSPVLSTVFGLPGEASGALLIGFLRKDVAVGMLVPLDLTMKQLIVASVVLVTYFPCVASFIVLLKEFGVRYMILAMLMMIFVSLLAGGLLNLILH